MKPLLAGKVTDVNKLRYPLVASPKIDGIRCLIINGAATSRTLKRIPNAFIFNTLGKIRHIIDGMDGELTIPGVAFNEVSSAVMGEMGIPKNFEYRVFDIWSKPDVPYVGRALELLRRVPKDTQYVKVLTSSVIQNPKELLAYEDNCLADGYEGVMVRSCDGKYKYGRSTTNEQILLKLKRMEDAEAVIIGGIEGQANNNVATVNKLGHTERSSHKANLRGKGCLGAFTVRRADGVEFEVGTGFTAEQRELYWRGLDKLIGKTIVYKYQFVGSLDKPRFPSFKAFRHEDDMS